MAATIKQNAFGDWYIALNDDQTEWIYWGAGLLEDAVASIPALLEEYPDITNKDGLQKLYDESAGRDYDELVALTKEVITNA